jgi:hypothetical protein
MSPNRISLMTHDSSFPQVARRLGWFREFVAIESPGEGEAANSSSFEELVAKARTFAMVSRSDC